MVDEMRVARIGRMEIILENILDRGMCTCMNRWIGVDGGVLYNGGFLMTFLKK